MFTSISFAIQYVTSSNWWYVKWYVQLKEIRLSYQWISVSKNIANFEINFILIYQNLFITLVVLNLR